MLRDNWLLDNDNEEPLHAQLQQRIMVEIQQGRLKVGDRIPSERELMQLSNVSRATVRHAIHSLVQQKILDRVQGRGTFVRQDKLETSLEIVYSFAEQLRAMGLELENHLLENEKMPASPLIAHKLGLEPGEPIISLQRLRSLDGEPIMVNVVYMPYKLCPGILHETFENTSLYRLMVESYNLPIVSATDTLEAEAADETIAQYLQIPVHTPVMFVKRLAFTTGKVPLHIGYNYIRGDRIRFRSDMQSMPASIEVKLHE